MDYLAGHCVVSPHIDGAIVRNKQYTRAAQIVGEIEGACPAECQGATVGNRCGVPKVPSAEGATACPIANLKGSLLDHNGVGNNTIGIQDQGAIAFLGQRIDICQLPSAR